MPIDAPTSPSPSGSPASSPGNPPSNPPAKSPSAPSLIQTHSAPAPARSTQERPATRPPAQHDSSPIASEPARRGSSWTTTILFAVLAAAATAGWVYRERWLPQVTQLWSAEVTKKPLTRGPIPVVTAPVVMRDMPLYLNGLGTVTALKTVTIRSRVEGELTKVVFEEGQRVREGDLLAEIDPRPFEIQRDQAAGQLARDEATLKAARLTLERLQNLSRTQAVSTQEVENQSAIVEQTEGVIKTDRAMVSDAELQLTYCKIVSPITGIIGLRLVDVGNIVRANDPNGLAVINQVEPIALVFTISQDDIPRVQKQILRGDPLQVEAYNRDFTVKLATGKLLATDNQVDATTGTLRLKAVFEQNEATLFPNQFVNTRLLVEVKKDAIVIPSAAIQRGPNSKFVYVVKADERVELRAVEVGPSEGAETSIVSGLAPGEIVVTEGLDKLEPEAKVSYRQGSAAEMKAAETKASELDATKPVATEPTTSGAPDSAAGGQAAP